MEVLLTLEASQIVGMHSHTVNLNPICSIGLNPKASNMVQVCPRMIRILVLVNNLSPRFARSVLVAPSHSLARYLPLVLLLTVTLAIILALARHLAVRPVAGVAPGIIGRLLHV